VQCKSWIRCAVEHALSQGDLYVRIRTWGATVISLPIALPNVFCLSQLRPAGSLSSKLSEEVDYFLGRIVVIVGFEAPLVEPTKLVLPSVPTFSINALSVSSAAIGLPFFAAQTPTFRFDQAQGTEHFHLQAALTIH
jgi:hypothetical protein